jgi:hypothetical protein
MRIIKVAVIALSKPLDMINWDGHPENLLDAPFDEFTEARILQVIRQNPLTGEMIPAELIWEGNRSIPIIMGQTDLHFLKKYGICFPWSVEIQESRPYEPYVFYPSCKIWRTDIFPGYVFNRLESDLLAVVNWFRYQLFCRLILIAQVLDLAYVPPGTIPNRNHLFKRSPLNFSREFLQR